MLKLICLGASSGLACSGHPGQSWGRGGGVPGGYLMRFRVGSQVTWWRPPLRWPSQEAAPLQVGWGARVLGRDVLQGGLGSLPAPLLSCPADFLPLQLRLQGGRGPSLC